MDQPFGLERKLTSLHVEKLIDLYRLQPRLWNQSHPEFRDTELCRQSWQEITTAWNEYCDRNFSVTDVRIRISTICQRFMKQRQRLEAEGGSDNGTKFVHYDSLKFLVQQQALQHRRDHCARENSELIKIYEHYPVLWHNAYKHLRCPDKRDESYRGISAALKLLGVNLTPFGVQRRLQTLRKIYRLEKVRYLQNMIEGKDITDFETNFQHYHDMEFLHKHIDPYICAGCGKIFENLMHHREHIKYCVQETWLSQDEPDKTVCANNEYEEVDLNNSATITTETTMLPNINNNNYETNYTIEQSCIDQVLPSSTDSTKSTEAESIINIANSIELFENANEADCIQKISTVVATPVASASQAVDNALMETGANNLHLCANEEAENKAESPKKSTITNPRLTVQQTHALIDLYKAQQTLWNPNHLDYNDRGQRHIAWKQLAEQLNSIYKKDYTWQQLHRKLMDFTKYYRREYQRTKVKPNTNSKWCFYNDFRFLDDVLSITDEIQKSSMQRDANLKIIEVYKAHPQLWCTDHDDYTKRKLRQRYIESMCTILQEDYNIQITMERLKSRIIEFRVQYRNAKAQRLQTLKCNGTWQPSYDYYEALEFLDKHVAPFVCADCNVSFKRFTDYLLHQNNVHKSLTEASQGENYKMSVTKNTRRSKRNKSDSGVDNALDHICHICGMKFSIRTSLLSHLHRHLGHRTHSCTECPKKFFNSTALSVHIRSHTKELPFVCEICARGFVNASKLNQHVKRHRNQRDFPCTKCEKAFFTAFELDRHMRSHMNIRDKICPVCGRAFVLGSGYYAHLNLHRDSKRYACEKCDKRFAQYAGLYKHRKRCPQKSG